ncbi:MAG TPA: DUF2306 domain-containing protein [Herpetosiphonaceae bacterium]
MHSTKPGTRVSRGLWIAVSLLALIGVAVVVRRTVVLVPVLVDGYQPPAATSDPTVALDDVFARYPLLTLIHIIPGLLFMILWPLQFSATIRRRHLGWHRGSGRVAVICGLIIGVTALVMSVAMPAIGGVNQAASTILFGLFFLFALGHAFRHIRRRNIALHREWMIRAFSIGLAVATIRPIIGLFFATSPLSGLTPYEFFGTAFWIGFTLHLVAAEAWIHWTRPRLAAQPARRPVSG